MKTSPRQTGLLPRLTLLAFLLLAQGLVFAHEIDHFAAGEANLCALCSIGHGLEHAACAGQPAPLAGPDVPPPAERPAIARSGAASGIAQARAPPRSLLPF